MADERRTRIAARYDDLREFFSLQWGEGDHRSVHFGYYETADTDAATAMQATTRELATFADVGTGDAVLDLGCGAGGDAIWLARRRGATVLAVDLVEAQLAAAAEAAAAAGVADRVDFRYADFHDLGGLDRSFDVAWALESLSHSTDPQAVFDGVADVLASDGRFVVADVVLADETVRDRHRDALESIAAGMGLQFRTPDELRRGFEAAGFGSVTDRDVTPAIMPGVDDGGRTGSVLGSLARAGNTLGVASSTVTRYLDVRSELAALLDDGALEYHFLRASDPPASATD